MNLNSKNKPFIIAEMSGNHNHSLERALQIVEAAAESGVDALKIQTYTQDTMTLDCDTPDFELTIKILFGMVKNYMTYTEKLQPLMNGISLFLINVKNSG